MAVSSSTCAPTRAPPTASHTVYHISRQGRGQSCGVIVRDGLFVPHPTQAAILEAVAKSYNVNPAEIRAGRASINHIFVEDIAWTPPRAKSPFSWAPDQPTTDTTAPLVTYRTSTRQPQQAILRGKSPFPSSETPKCYNCH